MNETTSTKLAEKFISYDALPKWLAQVAEHATVYAPRREGTAVLYRAYTEGDPIELKVRPTESAKHILFPRGEELFSFQREHDPQTPGKSNLRLHEPDNPGPAVVFGALSCDARGFLTFDPVYNGSGTGGQARDVYYLKRRAQTTFIVHACNSALATCFCNWVGGGPTSTQGADILATDVEGGLLLQAITEQGAALLEAKALAESTEAQRAEARERHVRVEASMEPGPDLSKAAEALLRRFEDREFWLKQSAGCLSCGACSYLCPTCHCFTITDESNGISGTRLRSWDTCMSSLFTMEASGHNPRNGKAMRLKNRLGHKFSYYPGLHDGHFACCGCGRCIKSCPSSVDIRNILLNAIKEASHV